MDYICYISHSKIDQLHAQVEPEQVSDITEHTTSERSRLNNVSTGLSIPKVLTLFGGGITYGRKDVIQRQRRVKVAYTEKLRDVLLAIAADQGDILDLTDTLRSGKQDSVYYYYEGSFRAEPLGSSPDSSSICRINSTSDRFTVTLSCSLQYFSESNDGNLINSGNHLFFEGVISLRFGGVLVLLGQDGDQVFGTPLYLQLIAPSRHTSL